MVDFNQQCHLLFDHPELLVHRLEVVSEEAGPVKQLLEVPQGDLPDGARQAAMSDEAGLNPTPRLLPIPAMCNRSLG